MKYKLKGIGAPTYHLSGNFKHVNEPEKILTGGAMIYVKRMMTKHKTILIRKFQKNGGTHTFRPLWPTRIG